MDLIDLLVRRRSGAALGLLLVPIATLARAQTAPRSEGTVVALDHGELVLDLGAAQGASEGLSVELWRPLKLRHPLTGKPLQERFLIGTVRLIQVRPAMSLATVEGTPARAPAPGDLVLLRRAAPSAPAPSSSAPGTPPPLPSPAAPPAAELDPESVAVLRLLDELRGAPPEVRAARYEQIIQAWPQGRASQVLREEALLLRGYRASEAPAEPARRVGFVAPERLVAGQPVDLAVELPDGVRGAVLHFKRASEATYRSRPMRVVGTGYASARLEGDEVAGSSLDYFIEGVSPDGRTRALVGQDSAPRHVAVNDAARAAQPVGQGDTTTSLWVDYANYNLRKHNDYVLQTEGFFGLRLQDVGVRAVRSGFGVYRGVGGTLRELDDLGLPGRKVGLTYGYLEGELAPSATLSFVVRAALGLRDDGVSGGGQLFVRIGHDRRTNLLLGGEFLGGVGLRGITQLEWRTIPRVPITLRTEVTNQPAGVAPSSEDPAGLTARGQSEVGLRAIVQAGYELTPTLTVAGRFSYQGRTINHAGPGLGAAVTYQW